MLKAIQRFLTRQHSVYSSHFVKDFERQLNGKFHEAWNAFSAKDSNSLAEEYSSCSSFNRHYKTANWWGGDTLENYIKRGNKRYTEKDVTYTIDENCFRVYNKWGGEKTIACFGCSNTIGIGLPDKETWPYILNEIIGSNEYTCYNYGVNGGSADTISRLIASYLNTSKPHAIICLFPDMFRMEYVNVEQARILNFSPTVSRHSNLYTSECTAIKAFTNEYFAFFNLMKNINFIESLCSNKGVKFIWHTWTTPILRMDPNTIKRFTRAQFLTDGNKMLDPFNTVAYIDDLARDGIHFGPHYTNTIAQAFAKKL